MKEERGITIIALIIYVALITFVVAGVSAITRSFYSNINEYDTTSESATSFAKFNMYFINDIKAAKVSVKAATSESIELSVKPKTEGAIEESVTYSVKNGILYRNKVKICGNVKEAKFETSENSTIIKVYLKINKYEKTTTYKLEPSETEGDAVIT